MKMICPKCGFEQPDAPECARCGIIIAKYRAREDASTSQVRPESEVPPRSEDTAPGWVGRASAPGDASAPGSRFSTIDQDSFRRAQAQEATRKFIAILGVAGGIILILAVGVSFFRVYNNFAKLEADINSYMGQLSTTDPPATHDMIKDRVKYYGFEIEGGDFIIHLTGSEGTDLDELTKKLSITTTWTLNGEVNFNVIGTAVRIIPIKLSLKSSARFMTRGSANTLRRWAGLEPLPPEPEEDKEEEYLFEEWQVE
jgi:hypothetical protein